MYSTLTVHIVGDSVHLPGWNPRTPLWLRLQIVWPHLLRALLPPTPPDPGERHGAPPEAARDGAGPARGR